MFTGRRGRRPLQVHIDFKFTAQTKPTANLFIITKTTSGGHTPPLKQSFVVPSEQAEQNPSRLAEGNQRRRWINSEWAGNFHMGAPKTPAPRAFWA